MTPRSDSERWFIATWPAILTFLLGWFIFIAPSARERSDLSKRIRNQGTIGQQREQLAAAESELAAVKHEQETLRREIDERRVEFDRGLAMRRISALCGELDLQITKASEDKSTVRLPVALKKSITATHPSRNTAPQVWCVELSGSYSSVLGLLQGLASSAPLVVPLNLAMETDPKERLAPTWKLYIWL